MLKNQKCINLNTLDPIDEFIKHVKSQENKCLKFIHQTQLAELEIKTTQLRLEEELEVAKTKCAGFTDAIRISELTKTELTAREVGKKRKLSELDPKTMANAKPTKRTDDKDENWTEEN